MPGNNDDRTWILISVKLSGEAGNPELMELEGLIKTNPAVAKQLQLLEAWWNNHPMENDLSCACFFEKLQDRLSAKNQ